MTLNSKKTPKTPLAGWIRESTKPIDFDSIFCPFSGNASIPRVFKSLGKEVITSDALLTYSQTALAFIENDNTRLDAFEAESLVGPNDHIMQQLEGIVAAYGLPPVFGEWLDKCHANLDRIDHEYKKALATTVISKVISFVMEYGDDRKSRLSEEDWISTFHYYVLAVNENVFSTDKSCIAHQQDSYKLVPEIIADAMYFYLYSPDGITKLRPTERLSELFNRYCFEKELDYTLETLIKSGPGTKSLDAEQYLANLAIFLEASDHIPNWFIATNSAMVPGVDSVVKLISEYRKNTKLLSKEIVFSANYSRTEHFIVALA
ncbi:MAG TPA: hypothetical protein PLQ76_08355 [bacterium]|nr:hypothetical protein [bacterium]